VGVIKDFNFGSLRDKIEPLILRYRRYDQDVIVKIKAGTEKTSIGKISEIYKKFNAGQPFEFTFMDDDYMALYKSEMLTGKLSAYFAGLAVIISCLGLLGLTAFTIQKRQKEIGIRKVLGSSEFAILYLLSSEFSKLVLTSIVIAVPLSFLLTRGWLDSFAYRIDLNAWYFVSSGIITLLIAWFTIGAQALKAVRINPSQSLRDE
jgi:ABC-type antimicrobial peptide transport system permease subunit